MAMRTKVFWVDGRGEADSAFFRGLAEAIGCATRQQLGVRQGSMSSFRSWSPRKPPSSCWRGKRLRPRRVVLLFGCFRSQTAGCRP